MRSRGVGLDVGDSDAELANGFVEQWLSESAEAVALVEHARRDERAQIIAWARATEASIR